MARPRTTPLPPLAAQPDLPRLLDDAAPARHGDLEAVRLSGLTGDVDAAHARIGESVIAEASVDRFDLTGAVLADVVVERPSIVELVARDGSWRTVIVRGGRIGTLDLGRGRWDVVRLEDVRIDYLSTPSATLRDVELVGCTVGTWDAPGAQIERMRLTRTTVGELDTREMRATDLDLRAAEVAAFTDVRDLRGATLTSAQAAEHAATLAGALGIDVRNS